jgi:aromatic-L-amino-acid decarboxylase
MNTGRESDKLSPMGDTAEFQRAIERATRWISDYLEHPERYPVLSQVAPGEIRAAFPTDPPEHGRRFDEILEDFEEKIVPGITHWNHPSFFAYFAITGSLPGILGELLAAALNVNGMLWRTSPSLTELEGLTLDYLRKMIGLEGVFFGQILDTASTSTLVAMAAARGALSDLDIRRRGMGGRNDLPPLVLYESEEAHSSIDKAGIVLGIGTENMRRIRTDERFRMDPEALEAAIMRDERAGRRPFCVVATVGTTSTTSVDPVRSVAEVCARHGVWLHVDAAYAWAAAVLPEKRDILDGCERADSIVVNPHKWFFTPTDLSVLYCRHRDKLRDAFTLVPEYLRSGEEAEEPNLMDYGFQLGRRFRALKLWMVINYFGVDGIRRRIAEHIRLAQSFKAWIGRRPDFELMAPVEFSTVCFRWRPSGRDPDQLDSLNSSLLSAVNGTGKAFLSHTKIRGRMSLRCAIGNLRTTDVHIEALERLLETETAKVERQTPRD